MQAVRRSTALSSLPIEAMQPLAEILVQSGLAGGGGEAASKLLIDGLERSAALVCGSTAVEAAAEVSQPDKVGPFRSLYSVSEGTTK